MYVYINSDKPKKSFEKCINDHILFIFKLLVRIHFGYTHQQVRKRITIL